MSINKVIISGNLTRDLELRATASGMPVAAFGVAVNDRRKNNQTGEWEDYPNFVDCTMFGNRATALQPYLHKGSKVAIEGKLRWSQWEKDGQKRSKLEVIVDEIELMSARQQQAPQPAQQPVAQPAQQPVQQPVQQAPAMVYTPPQQPTQQQMAGMPEPAPAPSIYDDDIPF